jgi:hypothetical protein
MSTFLIVRCQWPDLFVISAGEGPLGFSVLVVSLDPDLCTVRAKTIPSLFLAMEAEIESIGKQLLQHDPLLWHIRSACHIRLRNNIEPVGLKPCGLVFKLIPIQSPGKTQKPAQSRIMHREAASGVRP